MRKLCYWGFCLGVGLCLARSGEAGDLQKTSTESAGRKVTVLASAADVRGVLAPALANAGGRKSRKRVEIKDDPGIVFVDNVKSADLPDASVGRVTDDPIEAAYFGVKVWATACEKADSFDVDKVPREGLRAEVRGAGRREDDGREEPAHLEAGLHRRN